MKNMNRFTRYVLAVCATMILLIVAAYAIFRYKTRAELQPKQLESVSSKTKKSKTESERQQIKIACIGDSITYGAGVRRTRKRDAYPAKLAALLGDDYTVLNYGISGKTLLNETDTPYRKMDFFQESQDIQPDIVLIMLGTNDSKAFNWNAGEYEKQLEEFVNIYKNLPGSPQVYLMTCCAAFSTNKEDIVAFHVDKSVIANEVTPIIKRVAEKCEVPLIDIYAVTKGHPEFFADGVHPNARGNEMIAQTVYEALKAENFGAEVKSKSAR